MAMLVLLAADDTLLGRERVRHPGSPWGDTLSFAGEFANLEIDHRPTFAALVGTLEFIRENLLLLAARRAAAGERLQALEIGVAGAMLRGALILRHRFLPYPL
jgi:hypothetical protein